MSKKISHPKTKNMQLPLESLSQKYQLCSKKIRGNKMISYSYKNNWSRPNIKIKHILTISKISKPKATRLTSK